MKEHETEDLEVDVMINGVKLEQVNNLIYLESKTDSSCTTNLKSVPDLRRLLVH